MSNRKINQVLISLCFKEYVIQSFGNRKCFSEEQPKPASVPTKNYLKVFVERTSTFAGEVYGLVKQIIYVVYALHFLYLEALDRLNTKLICSLCGNVMLAPCASRHFCQICFACNECS